MPAVNELVGRVPAMLSHLLLAQLQDNRTKYKFDKPEHKNRAVRIKKLNFGGPLASGRLHLNRVSKGNLLSFAVHMID
jgi:hypothetical protein